MNKEQTIKDLRDRIAWCHNEAFAHMQRAEERITEANSYLRTINILEQMDKEDDEDGCGKGFAKSI